MPWYDYVVWFFSGGFLVNSVPHFVALAPASMAG